MSLKNTLVTFAETNLKANTQIVNTLKTFRPKMDEEVVNSFPSLRLTLLHIWDAETIWLKRLKGESLNGFPSRNFNEDNQEVLNRLLQRSQHFLDFIRDSDEDFINAKISFQDTSGNTYEQNVSDIILHCMNHSSFHRGQVINLFRQLDIKPIPRTDIIYFLRNKKSQT